jgi:CheY-like chemotaxis protein
MSTLLIADDIELNRKYLTLLLRREGYRVLEADDGDKALLLMQAERPDLAIVDLLMPTMDGFEFARAVQGDPEVAQIPVIFLSGTFLTGDVMPLARACGVAHVLQKSCEPSHLLQVVRMTVGTPAPTAAPMPNAEFRLEHSRLISGKLDKHMAGFATIFGEYLTGNGEAPRPGQEASSGDVGPARPDGVENGDHSDDENA